MVLGTGETQDSVVGNRDSVGNVAGKKSYVHVVYASIRASICCIQLAEDSSVDFYIRLW